MLQGGTISISTGRHVDNLYNHMLQVLYRESNFGSTNMGSRKTGSDLLLVEVHCVLRHIKQYFSYVVAVSFIGGGNRSNWGKSLTCRKSLTNIIT